MNLSNEEKFALADEAAFKLEEQLGRKLDPAEYKNFIWDFIKTLYKPKYE